MHSYQYVIGPIMHIQVLGHSLIMWDSVQPTNEWIQQHIPKVSLCICTFTYMLAITGDIVIFTNISQTGS